MGERHDVWATECDLCHGDAYLGTYVPDGRRLCDNCAIGYVGGKVRACGCNPCFVGVGTCDFQEWENDSE